MGFNFQAGHPDDIFEPGSNVESSLQQRFGDAVPLGARDQQFCLPDELGWSWWSDMQALAVESLGPQRSRQITATDAWFAVYLDVGVDRELLWPDGRSDEPQRPVVASVAGGSWFSRLLHGLGLRKRRSEVPAEIQQIMAQMVKECGPREGERQALQVGNLRAFMAELNALADALGVDQNENAVEALRRSYTDDDERVDDDPAIQCFCHAWLTASYAIANKTPLWLVK